MILVALMLASVTPPPAVAERPLPLPLRAAIRRHFDAKLFDGPSARYKWPAQRRSAGIYCGWVNAKNRLGAYTGFNPFYVMIEGTRITSSDIMPRDAGETRERIMVETFCKAQGYDIVNVPSD